MTAEQEMTRVLAEIVLQDRLSRALMGPATGSKGRFEIVLTGEATEAEKTWDALCASRGR